MIHMELKQKVGLKRLDIDENGCEYTFNFETSKNFDFEMKLLFFLSFSVKNLMDKQM